MRRTLSDRGVAALKPRPKRYAVRDPELRGHWIRVQPSGLKSFVAVTRTPDGKQVWTTIGPIDRLTIEQARARAREILSRVRAGLPAIEPRGESFAAVASNWVKRHVEANGLRSGQKIEWLLRVHILPAWHDREFVAIRRSDVAALLDHIEDGHGARTADYCLTIVRSLMGWYATRHDSYAVPLVRGMGRQNQHAQARARILSDDELRVIWRTAEADGGAFGALVRVCLLTAQRSRKVAGMRWTDIVDDEWRISAEPREKDTGGVLVLPEIALAIIRAQPRLASNVHVFAGRGDGPWTGWGKAKASFDRRVGPDVAPWVIHDLRRTARSLMSRAGVRPDIAERVLGHAIRGVEGVYDRHSYKTEKAAALARLAAMIEDIHSPGGRVVPISVKLFSFL